MGVLQDNLVLSTGLINKCELATVKRISLWWPIHIINPVDKTKLSISFLIQLMQRHILAFYKVAKYHDNAPLRFFLATSPGRKTCDCHMQAVSL